MRSDVTGRSLAPGPVLRLADRGRQRSRRPRSSSARPLDLGRGHWGAALVALPLLVAAVVIAGCSYRRLLPATVDRPRTACSLAIATGGLVALVDDARWAVGLHVAAAGASLAASLVALVLSFRGATVPFGPLARLRHADEAADHVAAAPHRRGRDVRRRGRLAERLGVRRDDVRARAGVRRLERSQSRDGRRHRQADG